MLAERDSILFKSNKPEEGNAASLDVVIEWPSRERAMEYNDSSEYKSIVDGRINYSTGMFIIVDGD